MKKTPEEKKHLDHIAKLSRELVEAQLESLLQAVHGLNQAEESFAEYTVRIKLSSATARELSMNQIFTLENGFLSSYHFALKHMAMLTTHVEAAQARVKGRCTMVGSALSMHNIRFSESATTKILKEWSRDPVVSSHWSRLVKLYRASGSQPVMPMLVTL